MLSLLGTAWWPGKAEAEGSMGMGRDWKYWVVSGGRLGLHAHLLETARKMGANFVPGRRSSRRHGGPAECCENPSPHLSSLTRSRVFSGDVVLPPYGFFCSPSLPVVPLSVRPQGRAGVCAITTPPPRRKAGGIDSLLTPKKRKSSVNPFLTAKPPNSLGVRGTVLGKAILVILPRGL